MYPLALKILYLEILSNEFYDVFSDCFDHDLDSRGNDIGSEIKDVSSAAACQELCNGNADCKYFTYGKTVYAGNCWLKSKKVTPLTSAPGLISGPKTCVGELVDKIIMTIKFGYKLRIYKICLTKTLLLNKLR